MMRRGFRFGLLIAILFLYCPGLLAAKVEFFDPLETGPRVLGLEEHRYLAFGEVMYDFYRNANFDAINKLLVNQRLGLFNDDTDYAELLLGDLYVTYGLPNKAEVIFNRLLKKDIVSQTRAQTWLHKATLHYREGNIDQAATILDSGKIKGLDARDEARRRLMQANILMADGDYNEALGYLHSVPLDIEEGRYATYNTAVALIRAGHEADGLSLLKSLLETSGSSDQALALRDRAALAAGLTQMRNGELESARHDLRKIRSDGPFSEDALLALGLANYRAGDVHRALPLWLEATTRNRNHPSVQEALLLAPRAYEELGALHQALTGYRYAENQYRESLNAIQLATHRIQQQGWADQLLPENNPVSGLLEASKSGMATGRELSYLYRLFSGNGFAQRFEHYRQIHQIRHMLGIWQRALPAMEESYKKQQTDLARHLPQVRKSVSRQIQRQQQLATATATLAARIPNHVDMRNPEDVASPVQAVMWNRVEQLARNFGTIADSSHNNALRLRRARGLLLWDIAHQSVEQREKQIQDVNQLTSQNQVLAERVAAVQQQIYDATLRTRDDLGKRLAAQRDRIERIRIQTEQTLQALELSMQNDALALLKANEKKLADQLAEAILATARVQDASVSGDKT